MSTITNTKRADWAYRSLQVFRQVTGTHDEDPDTVIRDFLCNLRHYCDEMAVDFDLAWRESAETYQQEIAEEAESNEDEEPERGDWYSCYVLKDDNTWEQPIFFVPARISDVIQLDLPDSSDVSESIPFVVAEQLRAFLGFDLAVVTDYDPDRDSARVIRIDFSGFD